MSNKKSINKKIRELGTLPDGRVIRGIEQEFDPIKEQWNEYLLRDGTKIRLRCTAVAMFRLVDDNGEPVLNPEGDPEIFVNSSITVISRGKAE